MCWNIEVSIFFGLCHLFTLMIVYYIKPIYYKQFITFLLFYTIMELFQAIQWYIGVGNMNDINKCSSVNSYLTIFAYILIWLQPVMYSSLVNNNNRFAYYYSIFTFINAMINIIIGYSHPALEMDSLRYIGSTNYSNETCTYRGLTGHLLWKFSVNTISYQPTHYVYYSLIILTFIMYYNKTLLYTIGMGWSLSLILTMIINGVNNETPSFWCLLSVCADIPIFIYTIYYYLKNKRSKSDTIKFDLL